MALVIRITIGRFRTLMHWMERMNNNNSSNNRHYNCPYPYNNQAFNTNASRFNMNQMPMPNQAYQAENSALPALMYETLQLCHLLTLNKY